MLQIGENTEHTENTELVQDINKCASKLFKTLKAEFSARIYLERLLLRKLMKLFIKLSSLFIINIPHESFDMAVRS